MFKILMVKVIIRFLGKRLLDCYRIFWVDSVFEYVFRNFIVFKVCYWVNDNGGFLFLLFEKGYEYIVLE